jgi:predicted glycosyltransferase
MAKSFPLDWQLLDEPVEDIHSLIYYSRGLISSGDSMAREAALLGVESYYLGVRDMPANSVASRFGSLNSPKSMSIGEWVNDAIAKSNNEIRDKQKLIRGRIDDSFIDIVKYINKFIKD